MLLLLWYGATFLDDYSCVSTQPESQEGVCVRRDEDGDHRDQDRWARSTMYLYRIRLPKLTCPVDYYVLNYVDGCENISISNNSPLVFFLLLIYDPVE